MCLSENIKAVTDEQMTIFNFYATVLSAFAAIVALAFAYAAIRATRRQEKVAREVALDQSRRQFELQLLRELSVIFHSGQLREETVPAARRILLMLPEGEFPLWWQMIERAGDRSPSALLEYLKTKDDLYVEILEAIKRRMT